MAYVRRKRIGGGDYYYLVESYRAAGKVRVRTIAYLGKTPQVPAEFAGRVGQPRRRRRQSLLLPVRPSVTAAERAPAGWDPVALGAALARAVIRGPAPNPAGKARL